MILNICGTDMASWTEGPYSSIDDTLVSELMPYHKQLMKSIVSASQPTVGEVTHALNNAPLPSEQDRFLLMIHILRSICEPGNTSGTANLAIKQLLDGSVEAFKKLLGVIKVLGGDPFHSLKILLYQDKALNAVTGPDLWDQKRTIQFTFDPSEVMSDLNPREMGGKILYCIGNGLVDRQGKARRATSVMHIWGTLLYSRADQDTIMSWMMAQTIAELAIRVTNKNLASQPQSPASLWDSPLPLN
jgi:hypothetical protein